MVRIANLLLVGAALVLLVGCESVEESMSLRKPTARLTGMQIREANPYSATVVFDVQIVNHYPTDLPLVRFSYAVSSKSGRFLAGSSQLAIRVPVGGSETVSLPARIDYAGALRRLGVQPGTTVPYEAQVDLTIETPHLGTIVLAMSKGGEVMLPQVSSGEQSSLPSGPK